MRKSHEKVCSAFLKRQPAHSGNLATDGDVLRLFDNVIARWGFSEDAAGNRTPRVEVDTAGWNTRTTVAVLNAVAILSGAPTAFRLRLGLIEWFPADEIDGEWYVLYRGAWAYLQ